MVLIKRKQFRIFLYILGYVSAVAVIAFSLITALCYTEFRDDLKSSNAYAETSGVRYRVYNTMAAISEKAKNNAAWEQLGLDNAKITVYSYPAGTKEEMDLIETPEAAADILSGLKSAAAELDYTYLYEGGNGAIYYDSESGAEPGLKEIYLDKNTPFLMIRTDDYIRLIKSHTPTFAEDYRERFYESPDTLPKDQKTIYEELAQKGYLDSLTDGDSFCITDNGLFVYSPSYNSIRMNNENPYYLSDYTNSMLYLPLNESIAVSDLLSEKADDEAVQKAISNRVFGSAFTAYYCTLDENSRGLIRRMRTENAGSILSANSAYSYDGKTVQGELLNMPGGITDAQNETGFSGNYPELVSKIRDNADIFVCYNEDTGDLEQWYLDPKGVRHDFSYIEDPQALAETTDAHMVLGIGLYGKGDRAFVIESLLFSVCKSVPVPAVFLVISIIVFLACVILILIGVPAKLLRFDSVPYEVCLIGTFILLFLFGFYIPRRIGDVFFVLVRNDLITLSVIGLLLILALYLICACIFATTARRIKCKAFAKSCFVVWLGKQIVKGCRYLSFSYKKALCGRKRLIILSSVLFGVNTLALLVLCIASDSLEALILCIVFIAAEAFAMLQLLKYCAGVERVLSVSKRIALGEPDAKCDPAELNYNVRELGETLNSIGDGLSKAVESSIRDERTKAELITNVSHDIKTPLTSIISYVDLLKKEPAGSEKAAEYIDVLDKKSQRLKTLIMDLIEVSKTNTGNIELECTNLNLTELLDQVLGEYEEKMAERSLEPIKTIQADNTVIYADGRRVFRIIDNILNNVVKYAQPGTRIYIDLSNQSGKPADSTDFDGNRPSNGNRCDNSVVLSIKNVSREMLNISAEELTERFVRGDRSRHTEGSGLGLSIAKNLTELQSGTFRIDIDGDLFKVELSFPVVI